MTMSTITATYPLAGEKSEIQSPASIAQPLPWGFWATFGWLGLAIVVFLVAALATGFCYGLYWVFANPGLTFDAESPVLAHLTTLVAVPAAAVTLVFAARQAGMPVKDYLGLKRPKLFHVLGSVGALVAFALLCTGITHLFPSIDQSSIMISEYRATSVNPVAIVLYWLTIVVSAPIAEEIVYRGFVFRGWSETWLGTGGALVLSSLLFAVIHVQYNILGMTVVFGLGILFGLVRWLSGSTLLAIFVHSVWNLVVAAGVTMSA
jgi:membrane protease YdiL (CAAX protease family)